MRLSPVVRIIAPTAVTSILLLLLGGVAARYLHRLQRESSDLLDASVAKVQAAEELEIISHELRYQLRQYLLGRDRDSLAAVSRLRKEADRWLAQARAASDTEREAALIDQIDRGHTRVFDEFAKIEHDGDALEHRQEVLGWIHDKAADEILQPAHQLGEVSREQMAEASRQDGVISERMGVGLLLLGTCGAAAGLLAGYGIARGIHRSLAQLTVPVRDASGKLSEVIGPLILSTGATFEELEASLQDVADRVGTVVGRLQESQLAAARAQQLAAMGQLTAGLAHELRNPLTSMKMLVQPAGDDAEETVELDARDLAILRQEIDRLEQIIQRFLDYARPPRLEKRPLVLPPLLEDTVALVARRAEQLGVAIQLNLPDQVVKVDADAGQIRQVLLNLMLNALEASAEGDTIAVRMSTEVPREPNGRGDAAAAHSAWMTIVVADRGCGLPADVGDRIFEPFVSTKDGGTGLGLSTCKRIVADHGGEIRAENREGGGAAFTVRLPLTSHAAAAPASSAGTGAEPHPSSHGG